MDGETGHQMAGGEGGEGSISVRNNKRRILGLEWSMSEVGTPPTHNLDKPHGLLASINNNNNNKNNIVSTTRQYSDIPLPDAA